MWMTIVSIAIVPCESRTVFELPNLTPNAWTQYNQEVKALLGPLHFKVSSGDITPAQAGELFTSILSEFLVSKPKFVKEENSRADLISHDSSALKKARSAKNALRKRAFGKNASKEDRNQAVKTHNFLKIIEKSKRKQSTSRLHET